MITEDYNVYVNGIYFLHLSNSDYYGDRPEFYRQHEKSLWILFNLIKNGHRITITNSTNIILKELNNQDELISWLEKHYPEFIEQLDKPVFTRYPHPNDILKNS